MSFADWLKAAGQQPVREIRERGRSHTRKGPGRMPFTRTSNPSGVKGREIARGAGSINCESEIRKLLDAGRAKNAAAMYDRHHSIRGCPPIKKLALWRRLYELGDARAQGIAA